MLGTVMSFNPRARNGVIREDSTNIIFYFDHTQIEGLNIVQFQKVTFSPFTNQYGDKVAINVQAVQSSNAKKVAAETKMRVNTTKDAGGRVLARVKFFNKLKGYGFLACETEPPTDAYLHINDLRKGGYESIQANRVVMVRLRPARPDKCPCAYDIKVPRADDEVNKLPQTKVSISKKKVDSNTANAYPVKKHDEKKTLDKITPSNCPQRKITDFTVDVEVQKLEGSLKRKKSLLNSVDLQKIPDGGQRLHEQINQLEQKLSKMKAQQEKKNEDQPERETKSAKDKVMEAFERSLKNMNISGNDRGEAQGDHNTSKENWFGKELSDASRVTNKAIEKLHHSLKSCPPTSAQLSDPEGLLVTLMKHQKQALAWMQWRESQSVSGGILADDMGLGKTLTMISIILVQYQQEKNEKLKVNDDSESTKEEENEENDAKSSAGDDGKSSADDDGKCSDDDDDDRNRLLKTSSTLIVAPASLIYHWRNEILNRCKEGLLSVHLFHGPKREKDARKLQEFDIVITTYDLVRRSYCPTDKKEDKKKTKKKAAADSTLFEINWRRVILDEAHQIKNYKSQQSTAACAIHARSRWAMSGTPVQNSETDLFAMLRFLHCSPFDEYKLWKNDVGTRTQQGNKRIKTLVSCFVLRRTKTQKDSDGKALVSLPSRKFLTHEIRLDEYELKVYRKLQSDSRTSMQKYSDSRKKGRKAPDDDDEKEGKKLTVTHLLVMLLRLRQCCCHLSLLQNVVDPDTLEKDKTEFALEDLFKSMSLSKSDEQSPTSVMHGLTKFEKASNFEESSSSSKIQLMLDLLKKIRSETPRDKCVIISQWTKFLSIVQFHLKEASISYATIDGSVSASKRMDLVDEFNNNPIKPKVMLISLQAGGVGLNLVGANHLLMLDMHWNPALEQQAFDRIYRVGQKKDVFVHKFVVKDTVEEKILKLQTDKLNLASMLLEGASAENKVHKLTLDDMKSLFGL